MCVAVLTTGDPQVAELRVQGEEVEHHRAGQRQRHPGKNKKNEFVIGLSLFLQPKKDMICKTSHLISTRTPTGTLSTP